MQWRAPLCVRQKRSRRRRPVTQTGFSASRLDVERTGGYPIERREGEIERLRIQAAALEFDAGVMLERIGVATGWRSLDLGCGPGGIVELLSLRVGPGGRVTGLDSDAVFLESARELA